ncbi:cytochrome p450 [Trifolium pratense]|uniref:Cytochrome p450 n=1 Tax=Trifolium pratense TaxID=57577 RepID=A0A2K3NW55_TRIPR|nr:cytochrome p450 [Trifolium pratense]
MINNTNKEYLEKITTIIYGIWYARNILVFQEKHLPPQDISSTVFNQLQEYQLHGFEQQIQVPHVKTNGCRNDTSWSPPLRGILKINVDAHLSSDGHWSTGLVLRRSDGSTVRVATRAHKGIADVVTGEAMGLIYVIDWMKKMGERNVFFELDSQTLVRVVKGNDEIRRSWGSVVRRCKLFLKDNPNFDIGWVRRKANQTARDWQNWPNLSPTKSGSMISPIVSNLLSKKIKAM